MKTFTSLAVLALSYAVALSADVVAPSVTSAAVSPSPPVSVNVTNAVGSISITMQITDDDSGLSYGNLVLYNQAGDYVRCAYFDETQRMGGGPLNRSYTITMEVPRCADPGTWRVDALVEDVSTNRRNLGGVFRYDLGKYFSDGDRTSGNSFTGTYETTLDLPQGSDPRTWTFEVFFQDQVGNNRSSTAGASP